MRSLEVCIATLCVQHVSLLYLYCICRYSVFSMYRLLLSVTISFVCDHFYTPLQFKLVSIFFYRILDITTVHSWVLRLFCFRCLWRWSKNKLLFLFLYCSNVILFSFLLSLPLSHTHSLSLSLALSVCQSMCLSISFNLCLYFCMSVCMTINLSFCLLNYIITISLGGSGRCRMGPCSDVLSLAVACACWKICVQIRSFRTG